MNIQFRGLLVPTELIKKNNYSDFGAYKSTIDEGIKIGIYPTQNRNAIHLFNIDAENEVPAATFLAQKQIPFVFLPKNRNMDSFLSNKAQEFAELFSKNYNSLL